MGGEERDEGLEGDGAVVGRIHVEDVEEGPLLGEEGEGAVGIEGDERGLALEMERGDVLLDAGDGVPVLFDERGVGSSSAKSLEPHGATAGVEVEKAGVTDIVLANVKDRFPKHPLRGACGGPFWRLEEPPLKSSSYDA